MHLADYFLLSVFHENQFPREVWRGKASSICAAGALSTQTQRLSVAEKTLTKLIPVLFSEHCDFRRNFRKQIALCRCMTE
jgi:hypothetical protein